MPTRKPFQRERDLQEVSDLYLQGWSQHRIAEKLNSERDYQLTQQTISNDLKEIQRRWQQNTNIPIDEHRIKELARIDKLEAHYWQQYFASLEAKTITTKAARDTGKGTQKSASERTEEREGNPAFLQGVERCIKLRCDLLGLNAPTESKEDITIKWEIVREDDHAADTPARPAPGAEDYLQ